jgi:Fe-Mn family superoxide dismutase
MAPNTGGKLRHTGSCDIKRFWLMKTLSLLFKSEATKQFGSAWVWLVVDKSGKLQVTSTQNQDNPLIALIPGTPFWL